MGLELADELAELLVVQRAESPHVGVVEGGLWVAVGARVLVDPLGLRLEDPDAAAVEPVLAPVAADVELRLVVGLPAEAVQLLRLFINGFSKSSAQSQRVFP